MGVKKTEWGKTKKNADKFPHKTGVYNERRFKMLFANMRMLDNTYEAGKVYGHFWMLQEVMCDTENLSLHMTKEELAILALDHQTTSKFLGNLIDVACEKQVGLLKKTVQNGYKFAEFDLQSIYLEELLNPLIAARKAAAERMLRIRAYQVTPDSFEMPKIDIQATQEPEPQKLLEAPKAKAKKTEQMVIPLDVDVREHKLQAWIRKNCKYVIKMDVQMTYAECETIVRVYKDPAFVAKVFLSMDDWKPLLGKHRYVKKVFEAWAKKEKAGFGAKDGDDKYKPA